MNSRINLFFLLIATSNTYTMNTQISSAAVSANTTTFYVPANIWKLVVSFSECKNVIRLVNRSLAAIASWNNRDNIINSENFSCNPVDLHKILFTWVENNRVADTKKLLTYLKKIGRKYPANVTNFGAPLWCYAQTEDMRDLLEEFGAIPEQLETYFDINTTIVQAARSGNITNLKKDLNILIQDMQVNTERAEGQKSFIKLIAQHTCQTDQAACLELLLAHISNRNDLLSEAVLNGSVSCATLLLTTKLPVVTPDDKNRALSIAARHGKTYLVKLLVAHGADQMIVLEKNTLRPLSYALIQQHAEISELLINQLSENHDYINAAKLHAACMLGDVEKVAKALDAGHSLAPLQLSDRSGLLHLAATEGHTDLIALLISKNYNVNEPNAYKITPLLGAVITNKLPAIKQLHQAGALLNYTVKNPKTGMLVTPCAHAVLNNNLFILQYLVQHGANITQKFHQNGMTLLHMAAKIENSGPIITYLIQQGLSIHATLKEGEGDSILHITPLDIACKHGCLSAVKALVEAGADMAHKNDAHGEYPIMSACAQGHIEVIQFFLEEHYKHHKELNPTLFEKLMECALELEHVEIVELLLNTGARTSNELIGLDHSTVDTDIEASLRKVQDEQLNG